MADKQVELGAAIAPLEWALDAVDAATVTRVRTAVRAHLARHAARGSDVGGAELILAELLANVARHAPGPVRVRVEWHAARPTLLVADDGPGFPAGFRIVLSASDAETGRGLALVQALGAELTLGVGTGGGARVSVVLPVQRLQR